MDSDLIYMLCAYSIIVPIISYVMIVEKLKDSKDMTLEFTNKKFYSIENVQNEIQINLSSLSQNQLLIYDLISKVYKDTEKLEDYLQVKENLGAFSQKNKNTEKEIVKLKSIMKRIKNA